MFAGTIKALAPRMRYNNKPVIENFAFKLHYQLTVTLLMLFVIFITAKEYFGDAIKCVTGGTNKLDENFVNSYCFFMGTYTVARLNDEKELRLWKLLDPGMGAEKVGDEFIYHTYYQWVPFVLGLQTICFYMPHYIWKKKEAGRMKLLVDGLQHATLAHDEELKCKTGVIPSKQNIDKKIAVIKKDILLRLRTTRTWSTWMVAMEVLNFVNVVLQILITDFFLSGRFIGLGSSVINFDNWEKALVTPLNTVFPKLTKCAFHSYGSGGSVQLHDFECVMSLSVVHEKIYLVLWFWFLGVFIVSLLALIWRIASFFLYHFSPRFTMVLFRFANSSKLHPDQVTRVLDGCGFGDWLFLYYLALNMHRSLFVPLFNQVAEDMEKNELPSYHHWHQEKGVPPSIDMVDYSDEMSSLNDNKKSF